MRRLGAFERGIEGRETETFGQRGEMMCGVRREDGQVERVLAGRVRGDGSIGEQLVFAERRGGLELSDAELVERDGAGFIRTEHVHAGSFLDGREARDEHTAFRQVLRAQRLRQRKGRRERHRDGGDQHDQCEGQRVQKGDVDDRGEGQHSNDKQDIDHHKIGDDAQNDGFQVRDGARGFDQFGGLAEVGLRAGGGDGAGRLALPGNRAGVQGLTPALLDRDRFAGERGLIDDERALVDRGIGGNDITHADVDHVARHQLARRDLLPLPIAQHAGVDRQSLAEQRQRLLRLPFLEETDDDIEDQQEADDGRIEIACRKPREHDGRFEHPGDRSPELA